MNFACHRSERAKEFRVTNYVSNMPKMRLRKTEADRCIRKFESYFNELVKTNFENGLALGSKGYIRLKSKHRETNLEISGNARNGTILLRGELSEYAEIHYSPGAIHVYRYEGGNRGQEAAILLNRRLPTESYSFGAQNDVKKLLG